jgi:uncharacterized protein
MSRAENLYHLQQTDSQIDRHNKRLEEIRIGIADDRAVSQARAKEQAADETLLKTKKDLAQAREQVQSQRTKIKESEDKLYSGTVANPKELGDIQSEAAALKRHLDVLEENQLEEMMALDEVQEKYNIAEKELSETIADGENRNQDLIKEKTAIEIDLDELASKREGQSAIIPDEDLQLYEKLRVKRAGVGVAGVQDRNCAACGSTLGTANFQLARSPSKLTQCETCERILFSN